jgi:hypothetical protein
VSNKEQDRINKLKSQAYDNPESVFSKNVDPNNYLNKQKASGNSPSLGTKADSSASLDKLKSNAVSAGIDSGEKRVDDFFSKGKPTIGQSADFDPKSKFTPTHADGGPLRTSGKPGDKSLDRAGLEIENAKLSKSLPPELRRVVLPRMGEIPRNNKNEVLDFVKKYATGDLNIREIFSEIDNSQWIEKSKNVAKQIFIDLDESSL